MCEPQWVCQNHVFKCMFNTEDSLSDISALTQFHSNSLVEKMVTMVMWPLQEYVLITLKVSKNMALGVRLTQVCFSSLPFEIRQISLSCSFHGI